MGKTYRLFSWNVNGIRAAVKKGFLDWFSEAKADVVCVQETKAMPEQLSTETKSIPSYSSDFAWAEKKGYSGVGTWTRVKAKAVMRGMGVKEFDREGRVLVHKFPEFTLFNVYFPNGKSRDERLKYKLRFYKDFLKLLAKHRKKGEKNIVVCGDVNTAHKEIDLARPQANKKVSGFLPEERAWIDDLLASGFVDAFRVFDQSPEKYTYWDQMTRARDRNVGWRIDYFFVSENLRENLKGARIHDKVMGSDHCPIELVLKF